MIGWFLLGFVVSALVWGLPVAIGIAAVLLMAWAGIWLLARVFL